MAAKKNATRRRLDRMGEVFKPYAGITPERIEEINQLVAACVALGGGQRPDESQADAMACGLGIESGAELMRQLRDRARCGKRYGGDWPD